MSLLNAYFTLILQPKLGYCRRFMKKLMIIIVPKKEIDVVRRYVRKTLRERTNYETITIDSVDVVISQYMQCTEDFEGRRVERPGETQKFDCCGGSY
jgi:hypothetical protein